MIISWAYVMLKEKEPNSFLSSLFSQKDKALASAIEWLEQNTRFSVQKDDNCAFINGGTEQEWKEIGKLDLFRNIEIRPDVLI